MCVVSQYIDTVKTSKQLNYFQSRAWGYKTFFMLNSTEHEISIAHKK